MNEKKIILGVTGGIACYKAVDLASKLSQAGYNVQVVMTANAQRFVTPITFRSVTRNPVHTQLFDQADKPVPHVSLAEDADLFIVAPATANIVGKIAWGMADDLLTTSLLACTAPKLIVPAMNAKMWENPLLQDNVARLKNFGYHFVEPAYGHLACGTEGKGRYPDNQQILAKVDELLGLFQKTDLRGKKIIITGGGTKAEIDPVRVITNKSSGKMGLALKAAALNAGAEVIYIEADTVADLKNNIAENFATADVLIMAAAVSDFVPAVRSLQKIKSKTKTKSLFLELVQTEDILAYFGAQKKNQYLVGFALESENLVENALGKLREKKLDLIVANDPAAIGADKSTVTIISGSGVEEKYVDTDKKVIAEKIIERICRDICK